MPWEVAGRITGVSEAAVAYRRDDMVQYCRDAGFSRVEILSDPQGKMAQSFVRAWK